MALVTQIEDRPTHLVEIFFQDPIHLGFCDASGIVAGCVRLDPSISVSIIVWCRPWLLDIITTLALDTNPGGGRFPTPISRLLPFSFMRLLSWKLVLKQTWLRPAQVWITPPLSTGAHGRRLPSTCWLWDSSSYKRSIQVNILNPSVFTRASRISWRMMHIVFLN